jgi:hypothetical protein
MQKMRQKTAVIERGVPFRKNGTPETGIDDTRTDREKFDRGRGSLRVTADEAMRGLGAGDFGG